MSAEELTLFGEPAPRAPEPAPVAGIKWSRTAPSGKCDACVALLVATAGAAPAAKSPRHRRQTATTDERLCHEHAQQQRIADGMPAFRAPRA